jgi:hypothetical protein
MPEIKKVERKVKKEKTRKEQEGVKSEIEETQIRSARKQSDFMETERQGLNWDPKRERLISNDVKDKALTVRIGGIEDPDNKTLNEGKTVEKESLKEARSGGIEVKGPKLDEKKEKQINEEKKGHIPKVPNGKTNILEPEKMSEDAESTVEEEVRKMRKDGPEK